MFNKGTNSEFCTSPAIAQNTCYKPLNFKTMTIKELKEKIMFLDDDMKVGGSGHFGEFLECWDAEVRTVTKSRMNNEKEVIFSISIEDAGDEPD